MLVNNAGVYEKNALDIPVAEWLTGWERTMRIESLLSGATLPQSHSAFQAAWRRDRHQRREPRGTSR